METDADALARAAFKKADIVGQDQVSSEGPYWHWTYSNLHLCLRNTYCMFWISSMCTQSVRGFS